MCFAPSLVRFQALTHFTTSAVVVERDESEFARLSQLGDILGLNVMQVGQVHKELAEQAFRNQVSSMQGQWDALLTA